MLNIIVLDNCLHHDIHNDLTVNLNLFFWCVFVILVRNQSNKSIKDFCLYEVFLLFVYRVKVIDPVLKWPFHLLYAVPWITSREGSVHLNKCTLASIPSGCVTWNILVSGCSSGHSVIFLAVILCSSFLHTGSQVRSLPRHAVRVHSIKSLMPRQYLHRGGQETKAISFVWQMTIGTISLVCLQRCFQEVVCLLFGHFVSFWSCPCLLLGCFVSSWCLCLSLWDCFVSVQRHFVSPEDVVSLRLLCVSWRLFPVLVVSFCSFLKAFLHLRRQCVSLWGCFESVCFFVVTLCVWGFVFLFCVSGVHFCLLLMLFSVSSVCLCLS